jgi:hypothetical protein
VLKKTITYNDFNDQETEEVFFFHLSKQELVELEMSKEGGFVDSMKRVQEAGDHATLIKEMKNIILMSYGKKTPDGKRFVKNQQIREEFESTKAFEVLFMELATDAAATLEFFQGIIPSDLAAEAQAIAASPNGAVEVKTEAPRVLTRAEAIEMDMPELQAGLASGRFVLGE